MYIYIYIYIYISTLQQNLSTRILKCIYQFQAYSVIYEILHFGKDMSQFTKLVQRLSNPIKR